MHTRLFKALKIDVYTFFVAVTLFNLGYDPFVVLVIKVVLETEETYNLKTSMPTVSRVNSRIRITIMLKKTNLQFAVNGRRAKIKPQLHYGGIPIS